MPCLLPNQAIQHRYARLHNRSGVRFAQPFLVGLPHGFLFTLALRRR